MSEITAEIIDLWSDLNPAAGYTGGHLKELTTLFIQSPENGEKMRTRIHHLQKKLDEIKDDQLRITADAVLVALRTQLDMARPSGAGPSGTGMGGVYAAADGIFYIVLKKDYQADFVPQYLRVVKEMIRFETQKWKNQEFSILVRKECLNTVDYMKGTLTSLLKVRQDVEDQVEEIRMALEDYKNLFYVEGLDSNDFKIYWPIFREWDKISGPQLTPGYPASLQNYYRLTWSADEIETMVQSWLELDLPVTIQISQRIAALPFVNGGGSLQETWDKVSQHYAIDVHNWDAEMEKVLRACVDFGSHYIIASTVEDHVYFDNTPPYLVNLVTGGEDFAVDYLEGNKAYSQLYLTEAKNTSLLTMINILVHEASHGYNFVLSAKHAANPLLNLNTSLEVPMTEGMAYYREYQYWAAAQDLLDRTGLNDIQKKYLELYGDTPLEQQQGVLCAQLETYIWRIIRYIRALCDVKVNGGKMTYTDFISWAAATTGLSEETLHGECFTLLASPGYAPCYAVGGAIYALLQKKGIPEGIPEIDFNTFASKQGFYAWPIAVELMNEYVSV